jgi:hypothetical protein
MAGPLLGLGLGLQTFSTFSGLQSNKLDERINRNISAFNARLAARDAELALKAGRERAEDIREDTTSLIGKHRAAFGVSNVVTTSGSPLLAQLKQREEGERAAQSAILEGKIQAQGFSAREALAQFESEVTARRGRAERRNILLGGAARGAQTFFRLQ